MTRVLLNRRLSLEGETRSPDGAGGFVTVWAALGTLWAALEVGRGAEETVADQVRTVQPVTVTVRAAPEGDPARPLRGQRFREGGRAYPIRSVRARDARGLYLTCDCIEEDGA